MASKEEAETGNESASGDGTSPPTTSSVKTQHDASFFDNLNQEAKKWREHLGKKSLPSLLSITYLFSTVTPPAMESLEEVIRWLQAGGKVGILDATNSTVERRRLLIEVRV